MSIARKSNMITNNIPRLLSRKILKFSRQNVRHHNFDGETYTKTNLALITKEDESHNYVAAYSPYGFRLSSGFHILGPCAIFPRTVLHWNVPSASKITPASLSLFCMLEPKLDLLLIGKGEWDAEIDKNIIKYLRSKKINVEILPTEQACSTFNFLNSERRVVAAGLIPPLYVGGSEEQFTIDSEDMLMLGSKEELDEFPEVRKTMESFRDKGIYETLSEKERHRKRSSGSYRQGDDETPDRDDKGKPER